MKLTWLGHASVQLLVGNKFVYVDPVVDPFQLHAFPKAELILVSSTDPDHCSEECVRGLLGDVGVVCGVKEASRFVQVQEIQEGSVTDVGFCTVQAMPTKSLGKKRGASLGFFLKGEGKTVYYPGDTSYSTGMNGLQPDVLLLPIGGTFSPSAQEAARWIEIIKPKLVIPIHWGQSEGTIDDAYTLVREAPAAYQNKIRILKEGECFDIDEALRQQ